MIAEEIVAPLAGAWIEITSCTNTKTTTTSLPSRERGLKLIFVGRNTTMQSSLPSRERGLKLMMQMQIIRGQQVAPLAGAWIEI